MSKIGKIQDGSTKRTFIGLNCLTIFLHVMWVFENLLLQEVVEKS